MLFLEDKFKDLGNFLFRFRSYTPLPFIATMIIFLNPNVISIFSGFVIVFTGEIIRLWSVGYAGSETRTTSGVGATNLVTQGPFRLLRNPLYLGNILIYTGLGIMSNSLFPFLQIIAFIYFLFQYYCIIFVEEDHLLLKFGEKYVKYKSTVNRIIPSFNKLSDDIKSDLKFNLKDGFISEKRTLQAIFIIIILIIVYYFLIIQ